MSNREWLQSQLQKRGVNGMKRYLTEIIGGGLAAGMLAGWL